MNTAEYLIKRLEEFGINDFFGLPGDYNFDILQAIENNSQTNWIGCTNELNAGYAADGYARQRGYGALVTTYGAGELSAMNAIAGSCAEYVPVIHIVGTPTTKCIEEKTLLHHNLNEANPQAFINAYSSVTAATAFLTKDNAKLEIDRVLKVFVKERKPVYIAIPIDIAKFEIPDRPADYSWKSNPETLTQVVDKILKKIRESKNPVILGDVLVKRFNALLEYKEFVEKTGYPTTNFLMGCGLIDADCKNYVGTYFDKFKNETAKKYLMETDCLISVGVVYSDINSFGFHLPYKINSHIAIYGTYTYVEGVKYDDIKMSDVLEKLINLLDKKNIQIEKEEIGYKESEIKDIVTSDYIYPRLQEFFRGNDIILAETGTIPYGICQAKLPNNVELHSQIHWASIGWATPAAFGAGIANRNSRVILITGEGAHQLTAMEIGNMLKQNIKPVVIVINNDGCAVERLLSNSYSEDFSNSVQINYSKFARSFEGDIWATKVLTCEDFDKALKVTQIMNKLCYIEVNVDKNDVPEIARTIVGNYKEKVDSESKSKSGNDCNDKKVKNKKDKSLIHKKDLNFGTKVHESLRDE